MVFDFSGFESSGDLAQTNSLVHMTDLWVRIHMSCASWPCCCLNGRLKLRVCRCRCVDGVHRCRCRHVGCFVVVVYKRSVLLSLTMSGALLLLFIGVHCCASFSSCLFA